MRPLSIFILASVLSLTLFSCSFDNKEYEDLKSLKSEYLALITEQRQANETMNRNIAATYSELESLKARLEEMEAQKEES
ncbi:MAG: hypothetical protein LBE38_11870 [Deltaproteobacteria bacterium]|jgi:septal ring factor EnvC (AmiA/AmiB activator)|nr:hypothetical protein [Deltaproteobacteria bacterium]